MTEAAALGTPESGSRGARALSVASYATLGSILCWTRLVGLDRGYWHDELVTAAAYVRAGPREILAGPYIPNNHELFSLLAWATTSVIGESEIVVRLWSVLPFMLGVIVVTAWLHVRMGALSGTLFLFLATMSPLLLDLSRQARGYGLAILAMSVLVVAALEAERSGRTWVLVALCSAGLVGTWTLPHFGIAFLATGAALLTSPQLRRRVAFGLGASILAMSAWYAPHLNELLEHSQQAYGAQISPAGVVTAPVDRILIPALLWIDSAALVAGRAWLPVVAVAALLIGSSPLLRRQEPALILSSGVVATVVVMWVARLYVLPRFLSFLLVPLFILSATGTASILARLPRRPLIFRTVVALTALVLLTVVFTSNASRVTRQPREAHRDAAAAIRAHAPPSAPVFAYVMRPSDLEFYLERPVNAHRTPEVASRVCGLGRTAVLVVQPWVLPHVKIPCLQRAGTRHYRFEQYARGGKIDVWIIASRRQPGATVRVPSVPATASRAAH